MVHFLRFLPLTALIVVATAGINVATAQTPTPVDTGNAHAASDTAGSALLYEFKTDYDLAFKAIQEGLKKAGYEVNYASKKRSLIETEFKQIANEDNFFDEMSKYGDVPYIRSPGWTVGRVKVTVTVERLDSQRVAVKVITLLSGFEGRFTNLWHYWRSNGKLEDQAMNAIIKQVEDDVARKASQQNGQ